MYNVDLIKEYFCNEDIFFQGYVEEWSESRWGRIQEGRVQESDITALLLATNESLEDRIIEFFIYEAGLLLESGCSYRLRSSQDPLIKKFRRRDEAGNLVKNVPDIFVTKESASGDEVTLVVAVELKKNAQVNYINCPTGKHLRYSNQIVCYAEGCCFSDELKDIVRYIWLSPKRKKRSHRGVNGESKMMDWGFDEQFSHEFFEFQQNVFSSLWRHANLENLCEELDESIEGVILSKIIKDWIS